MRGLIIKDFFVLKDTIKTTAAILVILIIYCLFRQQTIGLMIVPTLICAATATSSLKLDVGIKWDKIALTMPIERKDIVCSKFIELFIISALGLIMGVLFGGLAGIVWQDFLTWTSIYIGIMSLSIGLISGSIHLFLLYRFGGDNFENSEILLFLAYGIGIAICAAIFLFWINVLKISRGNIGLISLICLLVAFFVSFTLYKLSALLFYKKDVC